MTDMLARLYAAKAAAARAEEEREPYAGVLRSLVHPDSPEIASGFLGPTLPVHIGNYEAALAPAEHLGGSTRAILGELLGLSTEEIEALAADGTIG